MHEAEQLIEGLMEERKVTVERSTETGVLSLDLSLGGGLPVGSVEIYGDSGTGKTSLLYQILAQAQQDDFITALCPSEYLDLPYAKHLGIDLDRLCIITKNRAENVLAAALEFLGSYSRTVLAIDSATAFRPTDDSPGRWGELIEHFLYRVPRVLDQQSCVLMVNQVRVPKSLNLDRSRFFANTTDSAARKIASHFSTRLELSRSEVSDDRYVLGVNIVSNTLTTPGCIVELPFVKGEGIDKELDIVRVGLPPEGSWYTIEETKLQGEKATADELRRRPHFTTDLRKEIMRNMGH